MDLGYVETVIAFVGVMLTLSVLATAVVQMITMALNLRSIVLQWGLSQLIGQLLHTGETTGKPPKAARDLAREVMRHPLLSTGRTIWDRPEAIRLQELTGVLGDIAANPGRAAQFPALARELAGADRGAALAEFRDRANSLAQTLPDDLRTRVERSLTELQAGAAAFQDRVAEWFDTVMDRTTERFASLTRWVTLVVAVLLAVFLRVDTVALFKRLSTDPELRAQVIEQTAAAEELQDTVQHVAESAGTLATDALQRVAHEQGADRDLVAAIPAGKGALGDGVAWIRTVVPADRRAAWEDAYRVEFRKLVQGYFKSIQAGVDELAALPIFGQADAKWWGILLTALFLSLGAPFWFNTLRTLSNLRPVLARKVEAEGPPEREPPA